MKKNQNLTLLFADSAVGGPEDIKKIDGAKALVSSVTRIPFREANSDRERPFFVGAENTLVPIACHQVLVGNGCLQGDGRAQLDSCDPILIHGLSGTGKTHLLEGLALDWQAKHGALHCLMLNGADWARSFAEQLQQNQTSQWRSQARLANLFVLDRLDDIEGKQAAQRELISLLDDLRATGRQCLIACRKHPSNNSSLLPGLCSRLTAGLTIHMQTPGQKCRQAILQHLAERQGIRLTPMATHAMAQSAQTVSQMSSILSHCKLLSDDRVIDTQIFRNAAKTTGGEKVTLADICRVTSRYFQVTTTQLRGRSRRRGVALARNVAIHLSRELTDTTLKAIGKYFGKRDHTTVMHSCRTIKSQVKRDTTLATAVEELTTHISKTYW